MKPRRTFDQIPRVALLLLALVTSITGSIDRASADLGAGGPPPIDSYRVSVAIDGPQALRVTGLAGALGQGSSVSIRNLRTQQVIQVGGLADGSFQGLLNGMRGDPLRLQVIDAAGNTGATTEVYAAAWVIKSPYSSGGYWFAGQGHLHTSHSPDGTTPPAEMEAAYFDAGYDFVVSTDHRGPPSYNGAPDAGMTPDPDNSATGKNLLWSVGAELSTPQVHMGAWGISSQVPIADLGGIQTAVDAVRSRGGIVAINHPGNQDPGSSWDWYDEILPTSGYSLVEAFNGGSNLESLGNGQHIFTAVDLADAYQQVWWIGTDDLHDKNSLSVFNRYAIVLQTDHPAINQQDLLASADAGRHYIRESAGGPQLLAVGVAGNVITLQMADIASNYNVTWKERSDQVRQQNLGIDTVASYVVVGSEGYVRAEIERVADGKRAYTQPLFIADSKDLAISASNSALVDNSVATVWDAGAPSGSFVIDVATVRTLKAIRMDWDGADGRRFNYRVETSPTGVFGGEQKQVLRTTYSNRSALTLDFFDEQARFVRVVVTNQSVGNPASARIREVEIFDAAPKRTQRYLNNVAGSDSNSGLVNSPWRTFAYAKSRMRPRADLNFTNTGVPYPGAMSLGSRESGKHSNATIRYSGDPWSLTEIDASGANQGIELSQTKYLEWVHFDMHSATSENIRVDADDTTWIMQNRIHGATGGNYPQGRGVLGYGTFRLAYNLIYANAAEGVFLRGDATRPEIYNNVLYGNNAAGLALYNDSSAAVVRNNISSGNVGAAFSRGPLWSPVADSHNCTSGVLVGAWDDLTSIDGDPKFVNPAQGNFHLRAGSPCIDAGIDVGLYADFGGDPIYDEPSVPNTGSPGQYSTRTVDIGAVEVQACDISACTSGGGCHPN